METPFGPARLRIRPNQELGILDHDFNAPDASWTVPARVVPNADGAEFMITFYQPPSFTNDFFNQQVNLVDKELAKLKEILESYRSDYNGEGVTQRRLNNAFLTRLRSYLYTLSVRSQV